MNIDFLRGELARCQDALAQAAEQVRELLPMLADAAGPTPTRSASDAHKLTGATLAVHQRVVEVERDMAERLKKAERIERLPRAE